MVSRLFLRKLRDTLQIPVLALVDSDPYGLKILSVYMKGVLCCMDLHCRSLQLACQDQRACMQVRIAVLTRIICIYHQQIVCLHAAVQAPELGVCCRQHEHVL